MMPPGIVPPRDKIKKKVQEDGDKEKIQAIIQTEKKNPMAALDDLEGTLGLKMTAKDYDMKYKPAEKVSGDGDDDDDEGEDDEDLK
ncbi:MAG: hypothetical protein ABH834_05555 [Candidatus Altiarchaeota archaeon]